MASHGGMLPGGLAALAELDEAIGLAESRVTACNMIVDLWAALGRPVDAERARGLSLLIMARLDRLHLERRRLLDGDLAGSVP